MPLTIAAINAAKPRSKSYKLFDEKGLFLSIEPSGGRLWRLKYRFEGKEKKLALGSFPETGLKDARDKRDEARKLVAAGTDPGAQRQMEKLHKAARAANSFEAVAEEYIAKKEREGLAPVTLSKARWLLQLLAPKIGARSIADLTAPELLAALRVIEARGNLETARRMRSFAGRVFRYGIATGRVERDLSADIPRDEHSEPIARIEQALTQFCVLFFQVFRKVLQAFVSEVAVEFHIGAARRRVTLAALVLFNRL